MQEQEQTIRRILSKVLDLPLETAKQIDIKEDLQYFGMDSLNCIKLIVTLEETFKFMIPEEKLGLKFVRSIYDICKLVEGQTGHGKL